VAKDKAEIAAEAADLGSACGFFSFRMPSMTPIASLYAAIPISGVLVALFTTEQLINGLRNGFEHDEPLEPPPHVVPVEGIASAPRGRT